MDDVICNLCKRGLGTFFGGVCNMTRTNNNKNVYQDEMLKNVKYPAALN